MKLKCDFVRMLLVVTNERTLIPVKKARDENKGHRRGVNQGNSDA